MTAYGDAEFSAALMEHLPTALALVSADDGDIVYVNAQWDRLFGYDPGELVGRHISVVNAPTDQTPEERALEIFTALEGDGVWSGEVNNVRKDGTRFCSWCTVSAFEHPGHGPVWISANTDITRLKVREDALRDAEERFRTAFEGAPVGIAMVGGDMRLIDANRALCEIVGYGREELVGKPLAELGHPDDDELDAELAAQALTGEIGSYSVAKRYLAKNGDGVPVALTAAVVRAPDGTRPTGITIVRRVEE